MRVAVWATVRIFEGSILTCNADMDPAHIREYCELDGQPPGIS